MTTPVPRVTNSEIIRRLLERGGSEHSSVTITRNAKGETQLEVVVRTGEGGEITTPAQAEETATAIYDRLRALYPFGGDAPAS